MINIYIAGVGGKGEYLVSNIICTAILKSNLEVKSYTRTGLVQRNGATLGSIRIGKDAFSSEIPRGCGDIMLGLEPLETYVESENMKENSIIILNNYKIYTARDIYQIDSYPDDIKEKLSLKYKVIPVDFYKVSSKLVPNGCIEDYRVRTDDEFVPRKIIDVNIYCIGILAKLLKNISPYENWIETIKIKAPTCMLNEAIEAFNMGYNYCDTSYL